MVHITIFNILLLDVLSVSLPFVILPLSFLSTKCEHIRKMKLNICMYCYSLSVFVSVVASLTVFLPSVLTMLLSGEYLRRLGDNTFRDDRRTSLLRFTGVISCKVSTNY